MQNDPPIYNFQNVSNFMQNFEIFGKGVFNDVLAESDFYREFINMVKSPKKALFMQRNN